ncbi:Transcription initiation factor IIA subunit 2 [Balamuthia mandrillaris]
MEGEEDSNFASASAVGGANRPRISHYALYRKTTLGMCLTDSLDELTSKESISPELAMKVLEQFDKSMNEALATKVKNKVTFKGHLHTYRLVDNVWTFLLENTSFQAESETINTDVVKIVACDGKTRED